MNQEPFITIPLREGTEASVSHDDVRVSERAFALDDIQDARQVSPDPETIALRVAGERRGVELQPARPGDGALLLEALFRLRPALRPAGFDAPVTLPPGFPPLPTRATIPPVTAGAWPAQTGWSPGTGVYPPLPTAPGAPPSQPYGGYTRPPAAGGRLTPLPRSGGELIGAAFELFVAHWRLWLLLGLAALFIPEVLRGSVDAVIQVAGGHSLWAGVPATTPGSGSGAFGISSADLPSGGELALDVLDLALGGIVGAIISGWAAAVLGAAGRDALFGHAPRIGADLRAGLRRALPAIGAHLLGVLAPLAIMLPAILVYGVILARFRGALVDPNSLDPASSAAAAFTALGCLALLLLLAGGILAIYVYVRLLLAAYIAATEPLGPVAALRKSWRLTYHQWWHTFIPIFVVALVVAVISIPAGFVQSASFGAGVLLASPLFAALTTPLAALASVAVLYDLRLRGEGYAALAEEGATANRTDDANGAASKSV
jgi:hypothetical protein